MYSPKSKAFLFLLLAAIAGLFTLNSCNDEQERAEDLKNYIPSNSVYILQTQDLRSLLNEIDSLSLTQENPHLFPQEFLSQLRDLSEISEKGPTYVCFGKTEDEPFNFTYLKKGNQNKIALDSVQNKSLETFTFEEYQVQKYVIEDVTTFTAFVDGIFIASNSRAQLEEILAPKENSFLESNVFNRIQAAADSKKSSLFVNHSYFDDLYKEVFPSGMVPITSLAEWSLLDLDFETNNILLNGISVSVEGSEHLLNIFTGVGSGANETAKVTPVSASGFYSFTYDQFSLLHDHLNDFSKTEDSLSANHILNYTSEAGVIFGKNSLLMVLKTTDADLATEVLLPVQNSVSEFRGITIYSSEMVNEIPKYLNPLINFPEVNYYTWLDQFMVLAETADALEYMISNYLNKTTLFEQEFYQEAMTNLAGNSSLLMVANSTEINPSLKSAVSSEFEGKIDQLDLESYPLIALQFIQEKDFAHIHGVFNTTKSDIKNGVQQLLSISLETNPGTPGFLLKNHINNQIEVAVQDEGNTLHLFSPSGNLLWKKELKSRILGKIHQVDLLRNGNLQLAFTTSNSLNIIDRNGNPVKPFPVNFKNDVTQPLSVFDYDNNRNYRFVITQSQNVLMYDSRGKVVKGFAPDKIESDIVKAPKHIRFNNKDFIVFPEVNGNVNILDRQGNTRVKVKDDIEPSDNEWFNFDNKFVSTNIAGEMVRIDELGNVEKSSSGIAAIAAENDILVSLSENILNINGKEISLDFGLYTHPKIYTFNGTSFIHLTDTQAQRLYVFNKNGDLVNGFPVYGSTEAEMGSFNGEDFYISILGEEESKLFLYAF